MAPDLLTILAVAAAAVASPVGGLIALWRQPTTLFVSLTLGFASGVLLATIAFEMLPQAKELGSLAGAVAGFAAGFTAVYLFDLFIHRWRLGGDQAQEHPQVVRFYYRRRPRGGEVTVLAGAPAPRN
ncbi:MAG TPA: hypothetical protein VFY87_27380 [Geminicoccaceae bacterium]|nr:hypothetical protein [Geminicoccaceae bacterium]